VSLLELRGPVDLHVHLRDLDWSHKATFESETAAALAGGYWAVMDMPNTPPATTSLERLRAKKARLAATAYCDYGAWLGAAGDGATGATDARADADSAEAARCGVGLKMYCDPTTGELLVTDTDARRAHLRAWSRVSRRPIAVHAEGPTLAEIVELARETGARVHFCHVSERAEIDVLRAAKADSLPISVGVTPHHLYLTAADAARLGGYGRVRPPLKERSDVDALWAGIADGTVDVVESDHAPHTREEKESADPPAGMPGLETTIPLLGLAVREGRIDAERLDQLVTAGPQRVLGIGPPADTRTVLDLDASWVVDGRELRTASGGSPFDGMRVWGRIREVRIRGAVAFDGERVTAAAGSGRDVAPC
jgi:carbamoyl-phosphate synthase/aspartate carbamoyltransferase/dihydroorotase